MNRFTLILVLSIGLASAAGAAPDWHTVRDSLRHLPPNMRFYYLQEGRQNQEPSTLAESTVGLRLVGKWGAGPSWMVTGSDTLAYLSRGSEVVGACRDSGYVLGVANGVACVGERWGLYVIDAREPAHPHRVASWGTDIISVAARNTICCATTDNPNNPGELRFAILNVQTPSSPTPLGSLTGTGGYDMQFEDTLAFISGYYTGGHEFQILSIADSLHPRLVGDASTLGDNNGVWANTTARLAFVADRIEGLQVFDISTLGNPRLDTAMLAAGQALDISVTGHIACVAEDVAGLRILDVSDPSCPTELSALDTTGQWELTASVAARDSFAYMPWTPQPTRLRAVSISDPRNPTVVAAVNGSIGSPADMVLRDSLLYTAGRYRFQVVNVARPREPVLVGSCNLPGTPGKLVLGDTIAYASTQGLQCISIADPGSPQVVGSYGARVSGMEVIDTIVFGAGPYTGLVSLSTADPTAPRLLDSLHLTDTLWWTDVVVVDTLAYVGGERVWAVDVSDPRDLRLVSGVSWMPPGFIERMVYEEPYIYVACSEAGVCVLETTQVGIEEKGGISRVEGEIQIVPSPARGRVSVKLGREIRSWVLLDVAGRRVCSGAVRPEQRTLELDLSGRPAGVYVLELRGPTGGSKGKIVRQ